MPGDGRSGAPLAYIAGVDDRDTGDMTFIDLNTGLEWEVKGVGGPGTCLTALHGVDSTCTWDQARGDWINAVNAERYAGYTDWRVPTVKELLSLIDYSEDLPAVSADFPGAVALLLYGPPTSYWSSTPFAHYRGPAFACAWSVAFNAGEVLCASLNHAFGGDAVDDGVRAVRGGP